MVCSKCGNNDPTKMQVINEVKVKTKRRGLIGWCFWLLLACCTAGLIIIIPLLTNSKVKSKNRTRTVCMVCGNKWYI